MVGFFCLVGTFNVLAQSTKSVDYTSKIINPSFADGVNGWTNSKGENPNVNGVYGLDICKWAEFWSGTSSAADICQTITNIPSGCYSMTVQAFERPDNNGNFDGSEDTKTCIFMNDMSIPVMHIVANGLPENMANNKVNCALDGTYSDYKFTNENGDVLLLPNGGDGVSYAFTGASALYPAGTRYQNKCYGLVDDDGVLKIGLSSNSQPVNWTVFTNFRLTYEGQSDEAMAKMRDWLVEEALDYLRENDDMITLPAIEAVEVAIDKAYEATDYLSSKIAYKVLKTSLDNAKANAKVFAAIYKTWEALDDAANEYGYMATEDVLEKYGEVEEKMSYCMDMTTDQLLAFIDEMNNVTFMFKLSVINEVSKDNPADLTHLIANADFELGADNGDWTYKGKYNAGPNLINGITGQSFEFWSSNAADLQFDIYQKFPTLPVGRYILSADLANSYTSNAVTSNGGRANLYVAVVSGSDTVFTMMPVEITEEKAVTGYSNYQVEFKVPVGADNVIVGVKSVGVMDAGQVVGDNFTLQCYGTAPKITYMVDGREYKVLDVPAGEAVPVEAEPTKEGYTFSGWSEIPAIMPDDDVTITGTFTINTYKVNYIVDGKEYKTVDVEFAATVPTEKTPIRDGHTFYGWSYIPAKMPAEDITIIGSFVADTYKVIYVVDGKEYKAIEVNTGDAVPEEDAPVKDGYIFSGWTEMSAVIVYGTFSVIDGVDEINADTRGDVYNVQGIKVASNVALKDLKKEVSEGIYIINGQKYLVK